MKFRLQQPKKPGLEELFIDAPAASPTTDLEEVNNEESRRRFP